MTEDEHIKPSRMALLLPLGSVAILAWMLVTFAQIGRNLLSHVSLDWFAVLLSPFVLLTGALLLR